jgi:hypothetical protein
MPKASLQIDDQFTFIWDKITAGHQTLHLINEYEVKNYRNRMSLFKF